jgi:hypothetical protein
LAPPPYLATDKSYESTLPWSGKGAEPAALHSAEGPQTGDY